MNEQKNGKLIGYARVSTQAQELALQLDALRAAGCQESDIFIDKASGAKKERAELDKCLSMLQAGDTFIVWRLDRLGRSLSHLITLIEQLQKREIMFKSICDGVMDTTTATGKLLFNICSCFAEFERNVIQERTKAGLAAARARGKVGGRPRVDTSSKKAQLVKSLYNDPKNSVKDICEVVGISKGTLYNILSRFKKESDKVA